jgi:carboxypeptidase family protein
VKPGVWPAFAFYLAVFPLRAAEITVAGRVIDENEAAVAGAQITVSSAGMSAVRAVSDPTGRFTVAAPTAGDYLVDAECTGFFPVKGLSVHLREAGPEVHLVLNHAKEILQSVDVTGSPSPIDVEKTDSDRRLSGIQILDVPYPSTHSLRNAMSIMPGVIEDPSGGLHFDGGKENQTNYLLDGFNISDPLTGLLDARVSVESVQALDYLSGRYSPEFGKGSAGTLQIKTENGDDRFRYSATNFIPGLDTQKGLHLGSWTPRANLSGPILKGRAWFSDSLDGDYNILIVPELPKGQDQSTRWQASNILHTQVNLTPANILFGDFLFNYDNAEGLA